MVQEDIDSTAGDGFRLRIHRDTNQSHQSSSNSNPRAKEGSRVPNHADKGPDRNSSRSLSVSVDASLRSYYSNMSLLSNSSCSMKSPDMTNNRVKAWRDIHKKRQSIYTRKEIKKKKKLHFKYDLNVIEEFQEHQTFDGDLKKEDRKLIEFIQSISGSGLLVSQDDNCIPRNSQTTLEQDQNCSDCNNMKQYFQPFMNTEPAEEKFGMHRGKSQFTKRPLSKQIDEFQRKTDLAIRKDHIEILKKTGISCSRRQLLELSERPHHEEESDSFQGESLDQFASGSSDQMISGKSDRSDASGKNQNKRPSQAHISIKVPQNCKIIEIEEIDTSA